MQRACLSILIDGDLIFHVLDLKLEFCVRLRTAPREVTSPARTGKAYANNHLDQAGAITVEPTTVIIEPREILWTDGMGSEL